MEEPNDAQLSDAISFTEVRRPFGVALLSVLTGLLGLLLLVAFVVLVVNWRENNEYALQQRMAPSVFWTIAGSGVLLAFAASVGMWRGTKWGWWIACCGMVMNVLQYLGRIAIVNLSERRLSLSTFTSLQSMVFVVRGTVFALILAYWLRISVRRHFHVEKTSPIKAIVLAAVCGFGATTIVTVVLQFIFLLRTR